MGQKPLVFLSHSGADTEAARKLKDLLLASPEAREAGLKVWFDKDGAIRPGQQWQPQIEQAIQEASAFLVYVGSRGIVNWVDIEVRAALSRVAEDKDFLFIPVFAAEIGANVLPHFARLYQVRSPITTSGRGCSRRSSRPTGTRRSGSSTSRSSGCGRCARRRPIASSAETRRSKHSPRSFAGIASLRSSRTAARANRRWPGPASRQLFAAER